LESVLVQTIDVNNHAGIVIYLIIESKPLLAKKSVLDLARDAGIPNASRGNRRHFPI
jgi:hypothetical protein